MRFIILPANFELLPPLSPRTPSRRRRHPRKANSFQKPTPLVPSPPNFSKFAVAADTREVRFHFTPRFLQAGIVAAAGGALLLAGVSRVGRQRPARA